MASEPGRGRDRGLVGDDDLTAGPPPFSDEGLRRIVYPEDQRMVAEALRGRSPDRRSDAFADETAELEASLRGRRSLVPIVTALAAVVCFGAVVWYAYTWGTGQMDSDELPVVRAQPMPEKVRPEQPGGMDVPHQGMAVLNNGSEGQSPQAVERLLPRPEIPQPPEPIQEPPQSAQAVPGNGQAGAVPEMADASEADVTEPPVEEPMSVESLADGGIAKPVPKPDPGAAGGDQIAALLEQQPLETANGAAEDDESELPAPPEAEPAPAAAAPAAAPQMAALTTGDIVLQLSSVKSEAAAEAEWNRLQTAHPALLGKLPLALETAEVKGTKYYRVQTGPFASRDAAAELCAQLKAAHQDCLVKQR